MTTRSAVSHLAPAIIMVFGLGWLIGSETPWYGGAIILCVAAMWQISRNSDKNEETQE